MLLFYFLFFFQIFIKKQQKNKLSLNLIKLQIKKKRAHIVQQIYELKFQKIAEGQIVDKQHTQIYYNLDIFLLTFLIYSKTKNNKFAKPLNTPLISSYPMELQKQFSFLQSFLFRLVTANSGIKQIYQKAQEKYICYNLRKIQIKSQKYNKKVACFFMKNNCRNRLKSLSWKFNGALLVQKILLVQICLLHKILCVINSARSFNLYIQSRAFWTKYQQNLIKEVSISQDKDNTEFIFSQKSFYIIINFQQTHEMNIIATLPNYYSNQIILAQMVYPQTSIQVSPLLTCSYSFIKVISQALKTSIISYENSLLAQNHTAISENQKEKPSNTVKQDKKKRFIDIQRTKIGKVEILKIVKANYEQKDDKAIEKSQNLSRDLNQHITNTSELLDSQEKKQQKQTRKLSQRIKKDKTKLKRRFGYIKISNINLLEPADLPKLGLNPQALEKRRQSLFQRRVTVWDQKYKDKTNRRQIRMLNF